MEPLPIGVAGAEGLSVSAATHRMALAVTQHDADIFRVPGPGWQKSDGPPPAAQPIVASVYLDTSPNYSLDGKRIAFDSEATGHQEIWVAEADGSNAIPITAANGPPVGSPRWSPDGKTIAFDGRTYGNGDIFTISVQGGAVTRLTSEPSTESRPVWSPDGKFIIFYSDRSGRAEIWKMPSGGGKALQVTTEGGFNPRVLPGETWIYYNQGLSVWRIRESGGTAEKVVDDARDGSWAPYHGGIVRYSARTLDICPTGSHEWTKLRDLPFVTPRFVPLAIYQPHTRR